jgi:hypothetical protein
MLPCRLRNASSDDEVKDMVSLMFTDLINDLHYPWLSELYAKIWKIKRTLNLHVHHIGLKFYDFLDPSSQYWEIVVKFILLNIRNSLN